MRISLSADGEQYDMVYKRDGKRLERIIDVAVAMRARFVRVSLATGGPLHPVVSAVCSGSSKETLTCDCAARLYTSSGLSSVNSVTIRTPSDRSP